MIRKTISLLMLGIISLFMISCDTTSTDSKDSGNIKNATIINDDKDTAKNDTIINDNKDTAKDETDSKPTEEPKKIITETRNVRLFYHDVSTNNYVFVDTTVKVTDKAMVKALVNALQLPLEEKFPPVLSNEIGVKTAKLDKEKDTLTVDFSDNFITSQNLGSGPESDMLRSLTNTLGYNLGVNNVVITLNGKPYESGHIVRKIDEPFTVNYSNYKPY